MVTSGFTSLGGGVTPISNFHSCNEVMVGMPHPYQSRKERASGHAKKEEKVDMASPFREEAEVEAMVTSSLSALQGGGGHDLTLLSSRREG